MKYKILKQTFKNYDERIFNLEDEKGEQFTVDIFTDGCLECPEHETPKEFEDWLSNMVGKTLEIEEIRPWVYIASGKITIL